MNIDELKAKEDIVYRRRYEYACVLCKCKRVTPKYKVAQLRICAKCKRERIIAAFSERQDNLF